MFIAAVLVRVIWMFTGNKYSHWDKFISGASRRAASGILPTVVFYLFLRDKPPGYVGHNPVAASAYALVFGLYFLAIATGLVMRGASADVDVARCTGSARGRRSSADSRWRAGSTTS